jgi:hypothetical protein
MKLTFVSYVTCNISSISNNSRRTSLDGNLLQQIATCVGTFDKLNDLQCNFCHQPDYELAMDPKNKVFWEEFIEIYREVK